MVHAYRVTIYAMPSPFKLIAIGGGGFTHQADPAMEDFILAQSACVRPRLGFIGAASQDDPVKISRFYARFAGLSDSLSHLLMGSNAHDASHWANNLDIIYVGGGNTVHLLKQWRQSGLDQVLMQAARQGTLLAGVSAGAVAWFDYALSDAGGQGLQPLAGLGLVAGSCCPHYSSEPARAPAFELAIAQGHLPSGLAIDDGVAVLLNQQGPQQVFSARPGAGAYRVEHTAAGAVTTLLP